MRTWEMYGIKPTEENLQKVLEDFCNGGTRTIAETEHLVAFIERLSTVELKTMYLIDHEVFIEALLSCYAPDKAFGVYEHAKYFAENKENYKEAFERIAIEANRLQEEIKQLKREIYKLKAEIYDLTREDKGE